MIPKYVPELIIPKTPPPKDYNDRECFGEVENELDGEWRKFQ